MKSLRSLAFVFMVLALWQPSVSLAQNQAPAAGGSSSGGEDIGFDAKGAFSKILVAGLVGGIIGLSTLSFYDKPNQHLRNITFGAGGAMIGTALYMTLSLASSAKEEAEGSALLQPEPSYGFAPVFAENFVGASALLRF